MTAEKEKIAWLDLNGEPHEDCGVETQGWGGTEVRVRTATAEKIFITGGRISSTTTISLLVSPGSALPPRLTKCHLAADKLWRLPRVSDGGQRDAPVSYRAPEVCAARGIIIISTIIGIYERTSREHKMPHGNIRTHNESP